MIKDNANYISVKDLAELLDISTKTIQREIHNEELSAIQVGRVFRIHKKNALKWLERKDYIAEEKYEKNS